MPALHVRSTIRPFRLCAIISSFKARPSSTRCHRLVVRGNAAALPPDRPLPTSESPTQWINEDFYPKPGFGWQKPAPKPNLAHYGKTWSAHPGILNIVQMIHWFPFIPAVCLAYHIFRSATVIKAAAAISDAQVFGLLLAPLIQVFGSVMGVVMHEFEGWQVTKFKTPLLNDPVNGEDFSIRDYNNEWLRIVAYKLLFIFQGAGLVAFNLGALGYTKLNVWASVAGLCSAMLGPQAYKISFTFWPAANKEPAFPLALCVAIPFFSFAAVNMYAYVKLFQTRWALAIPLCFMIGGIIEGVWAETTFDQVIHGFAVVLLNAGVILGFPFYAARFGI